MPALSPTMTEGIINQWLVKVGDTVKAGDIIAEIETDKATMEVEAIDEGNFVIAQANTTLDGKNKLVDELISARYQNEFTLMPPESIEFMDVSPKQIVSIAASLMLSGVSKSGSPAPNPIISLPAALISLAFEVTAIVGDGFIRFKLLETMLIEFYNVFFKLLLTQNAKYLSRKNTRY